MLDTRLGRAKADCRAVAAFVWGWRLGRLKSHSVPTGPIEAVELLRSAKARALAL